MYLKCSDTLRLRDYQVQAVRKVCAQLTRNDGHTNPLVIAPTGAGKSLIIAALVEQLTDSQCLVITPRIKLLEQNAALIDETGILSGRIGGDTGDNHRVICGTYQTLIRKKFKAPNVIIVDEAHLVPDEDSSYVELLNSFPEAQIVGLTATPFRKRQRIYEGDNRRWTKVFVIDINNLIERGYLVPPISFATRNVIVSDDATDFELTDRIIPELIQQLRTTSRKKVLVFCKNIDHVELCVKSLTHHAGSEWDIAGVHSQLPSSDIDSIYDKFQSGSRSILVNCSMLTTGVNFPAVDTVVILRKISSLALYIQIIGRGLRAFDGKTECAIFDFGHNHRYGFIDSPIFNEHKNKSGSGHGSSKQCDNCRALNDIQAKACRFCQHPFLFRHVLSSQSSSKHLLSTAIQVSVIERAESKSMGKTFEITCHLKNGDKAVLYSSKNIAPELPGKPATYESLNEMNRVLRING